ncbi:hypothetical protein SeMB42_g06268 [Synchytrium endobioticum]|uniref:Uncharacterized protein n=1 Tax=Synchytrium endobioticum TaxID=286115 RepID=A0A507CE02_9FUNG|nr:hypothetical protein SeMB42_g06268 [Synchytrium endobioticum]TPX42365.1 hypothetical protein SeLEV6574_g05638 [Synchytrium endobioticum]
MAPSSKAIAFEIEANVTRRVSTPRKLVHKIEASKKAKESVNPDAIITKLETAAGRKKELETKKVSKAKETVAKAKEIASRSREASEKHDQEQLQNLKEKLDSAAEKKNAVQRQKRQKVEAHLTRARSLSSTSLSHTREAIDSKINAATARRESLVSETKAKLAAREEHAKQVRKRKVAHPQD